MTDGIPTSKSPPDYPSLPPFTDLIRIRVDELDLNTANIIVVNSKSNVYRHKTDLAVSISRWDPEKEIIIMRLLSDFAIPVVGYVVGIKGWLDGYIMPLAKRVPTGVSMVQEKQYMEEIITLVENLHKKGYIHGDVKLPLLRQ